MRTLLLSFALVSVPFAAAAQTADEPGYNPLYDGAPKWRVNENATFKLRGRAYYDFADINNDFASPVADISDDEDRTLRLGAEIEADKIKIKAEFDFINSKVQPKDVLIQYKASDGVKLQVGNYKEHVSLDEQTSSRFTTFMERGSVTDAFSIDRRVGASVILGGEAWSWSSGVFGGEMDEFEVLDDSWSASSRVTFAPIADKDSRTFAHLGASIRYREDDTPADGLLKYKQRPLAHLAGSYVATPGFAQSDLWLGLEAAMVRGPFHAQAEAVRLEADGAAGADASLQGGYIQAGWFLTGESRTYKPGKGAFDRTRPLRPLGRGGFGAFEIAARLDHVDLSDNAISGGRQDSLTLGANWYPTAHVRFMANYVAADIDGGPFGDGDSDVIEFRAQIDW